ncbi:MAG TPA: hypothetical protein VHT52_21720 [Stellaceae bacterium]|jgi:hypothetical protein|nr:hypothetical protein [Stellaceae bacterium]
MTRTKHSRPAPQRSLPARAVVADSELMLGPPVITAGERQKLKNRFHDIEYEVRNLRLHFDRQHSHYRSVLEGLTDQLAALKKTLDAL